MQKEEKRFQIQVLDVGQGDGIYIESDAGTEIFVDPAVFKIAWRTGSRLLVCQSLRCGPLQWTHGIIRDRLSHKTSRVF